MTASALPPETKAALQALLILGNARGTTFSASSEGELTEFVSSKIAADDMLASLTAVPSSEGDESIAAPAAPAVLIVLADASVREALEARYVKEFEFVAGRHNQFLLIGDDDRGTLKEIYGAFLDDIKQLLVGPEMTNAETALRILREAVVDHHVAIWQFARALVEEQFVTGEDGPAGAAFAPPCHEYDAEFQLALWGLDPASLHGELLEPILDLGCGAQASLVHYLREAGLEAYGIDKFAEEGAWVSRGDWLDEPLQPDHWGTIISHMGFSNHFFHHHLRKDGHPEQYARRFMDILDAIKPGGRFLYAPGLPFFESLLPEDRVEVSIHRIDVDLDAVGLVGMGAQGDAGGNGKKQENAEGSATAREPAFYATEIKVLSGG